MAYTIKILNKTKDITVIDTNSNVELVEIQRNRLAQNTLETKIILHFKTHEDFIMYGEPILKNYFTGIKITNAENVIIYKNINIDQENLSVFSFENDTNINLHIVFFEKLVG